VFEKRYLFTRKIIIILSGSIKNFFRRNVSLEEIFLFILFYEITILLQINISYGAIF